MVSFNAGITGTPGFQYRPMEGNSVGKSRISVSKSQVSFTSFTLTAAKTDFGQQNALFRFKQLPEDEKAALTYNGSPISELSQEQAAELVSEDGYFGVAKTSARISDFVLVGAGDDIDKLKAGRAGVLQGFKAAEKLWGDELPEICYDTLEATLKSIDDRISELGGSVVDINA